MEFEKCPIIEDYEERMSETDFCEDAFPEEITLSEVKGVRKTGARYRRRMDAKKREDKMRDIELGKTRAWVEYDYVDGKWVRTGKFIKHPKNSNRQKLMKRMTNKAVRKNPITFSGNQYKKCVDRWAFD